MAAFFWTTVNSKPNPGALAKMVSTWIAGVAWPSEEQAGVDDPAGVKLFTVVVHAPHGVLNGSET